MSEFTCAVCARILCHVLHIMDNTKTMHDAALTIYEPHTFFICMFCVGVMHASIFIKISINN